MLKTGHWPNFQQLFCSLTLWSNRSALVSRTFQSICHLLLHKLYFESGDSKLYSMSFSQTNCRVFNLFKRFSKTFCFVFHAPIFLLNSYCVARSLKNRNKYLLEGSIFEVSICFLSFILPGAWKKELTWKNLAICVFKDLKRNLKALFPINQALVDI